MSPKRSPSKLAAKQQAKASSLRSVQLHQVTLLLAAGQQYQLTLQPDDPLLHQLFQVMWAKTQMAPPQLLQIPLNHGQASLCVSSADLIAVVTEPGLFIKPQSRSVSQPGSQLDPQPDFQAAQPAQPAQPLLHSAEPAPRAIFLPAQVVQVEQFLDAADHAEALRIALSQADRFVGSSTTTNAPNYRESAILYATLYPDFYDLLSRKIQDLLPTLLPQLQIPAFEVSEVEMQMTAHNHGCFYKIHNDSGDVVTRTRQLTYVYYFYQEPQGFTGGELKLYDTELKGGQKAQARSQIIQPRNNSIVCFDSRLMHEVLPVSCSSRAFSHSRFTLNGWLRRAASEAES